MSTYAQLVIGPPGSGKTTYCNGMKDFLSKLGRQTSIINLDPANDSLPYECAVNISELITLGDVMEKLKLGPNGGLIYCMEFLEKNLQWLCAKIDSNSKPQYYLIDCPGQVELFTHNNAIRSITAQLLKRGIKLVAVHLVDSHYCSDPGKFISVLLTSLSTMLQLELPHINILSKIDLIDKYGQLPFSLDYYTEVLDLEYLLQHLSNDLFYKRYKKLNQCLIELVNDYSLVSFIPLNIQDKESVMEVVRAVDKAGGYILQAQERDTLASLMSTTYGADFATYGADFEFFRHGSVREQFISTN